MGTVRGVDTVGAVDTASAVGVASAVRDAEKMGSMTSGVETSEILMSIRGLKKSYGNKQVLNGIDFDVAAHGTAVCAAG